MELRHFRYFRAVDEVRHMTRAADRLGIQPPPLSQQIKALEQELGVQLFRRTPKGMDPTAPADGSMTGRSRFFFRSKKLWRPCAQSARGEQGRLAIGVSSSAAFSPIIPRLIRTFRSMLPDVTISLGEDAAEELIQGLRLNTKDVVFTRSVPENLTGISVATLVEEPMFAALPSNHKFWDKTETGIDLLALQEERFILYRRPGGPGLYDAILAACQRAGFRAEVSDEALRLPSTLNFVAAGLGVSIVPESLRRLNIEGVVYAPLRGDDALTGPLNIVYRDNAEGSTRRFIDHARANFEEQERQTKSKSTVHLKFLVTCHIDNAGIPSTISNY
jgi:DNA-binding transcriptional LysR family regulator